MWKKTYFIFLIITFLLYVYSSISTNFYISKVKAVSSDYKGNINYLDTKVSDEKVFIERQENDIIGYIKIGEIGLYKELYDLNSPENTVEKNIEILDTSDMPDVIGGNFILAAHSGFSSIAFFHDLNRLEIGDDIRVIYNNTNYDYAIGNIYEVPKTGKVAIKRTKDISAITLITCLGDDKQLVVIGYLI